MAKRSLAQASKAQTKKTALDLAEEQTQSPPPAAGQTRSIPRSTDRISISLLPDERRALEKRAHQFMDNGRRDLKTSRLARIAFHMLAAASDEDVLAVHQLHGTGSERATLRRQWERADVQHGRLTGPVGEKPETTTGDGPFPPQRDIDFDGAVDISRDYEQPR